MNAQSQAFYAHRCLIVTGESSGDLHAAHLVNSLRQQASTPIHFYGMGSTQMKQAGVSLLVDATDLAIVGFIEVVRYIRPIFNAYRTLKRFIQRQRPDTVVLVDYPGFNLHIAKLAKRSGARVIYYISPQIWAWRAERIKTIQRYVDHMAVIFPFEVELYRNANVPVSYVGHPLLDSMPLPNTRYEGSQFNLENSSPIVALLPGSRRNEIKSLLPNILEAAQLLKVRYPTIKFRLVLANTINKSLIEESLRHFDLNIDYVTADKYAQLSTCHAAIVASGTATLELTLLMLPMLLIYRVNPISAWIIQHFLNLPKHIGIANIIAGKTITQELLQHQITPKAIAKEIIKLLEDSNYRNTMLDEFWNIRALLEKKSNTRSLVELIDN